MTEQRKHQKRQRHTRAIIRDVQIELWLHVLVYWFLRHYSSVGNVFRSDELKAVKELLLCGDGNDQPDFKVTVTRNRNERRVARVVLCCHNIALCLNFSFQELFFSVELKLLTKPPLELARDPLSRPDSDLQLSKKKMDQLPSSFCRHLPSIRSPKAC